MDYEMYVGLTLNIEIMLMRKSWLVADGYRLATTRGMVDPGWYEAVTDTRDEAEEIAWQENAEKSEAKTIEKVLRAFPGMELE